MIVALAARAKLNLDLAVLGGRADGFHDIRTRMQAVALHDLLEVAPSSSTTLAIDGFNTPTGGDNLVLRAHAEVEKAAGRRLPTQFKLHKRIPPGSGLGGASSDAAAALRALTALHALQIDLHQVAADIGADVPFFLAGGAALAEGRGDRLTPLPTEPSWFAIAWPGIELKTAAVYRAWDELTGEPPNELRNAACSVDPRLGDFAVRLGEGWQMTGSGSAFFRACASSNAARKATETFDCWTAVTHSVGAWG